MIFNSQLNVPHLALQKSSADKSYIIGRLICFCISFLRKKIRQLVSHCLQLSSPCRSYLKYTQTDESDCSVRRCEVRDW